MIFVVGGGSGGSLKDTDAILTVTVPTGSTVTAAKGGTTLPPTMWVQAADATLDCALFSIPAAQFDATTPWTVTATLGTDSATATVLIDSNKQFDLELSYHTYLYNKGDQCTGVTGGWTAQQSGILVDDRMHIIGGVIFVCTVNKVSFSGYTDICVNVTSNITPIELTAVVTPTRNSASGVTAVARSSATGILRLSVTGLNSNYVMLYAAGTSASYVDVDKIWFE